MEIIYLGHSSFLIKDSKGRSILTDPFDESLEYPVFRETVDLVTISHHHSDHDYTKELQGNPIVLDQIGFFNLIDIPINGFPSYHDPANGSKRGSNTIYLFEMDGYRLCHLGDLGHLLDINMIDMLGSIDVLFIPVGGNFTLNGKEAFKVCMSLKSHIVIPMHYRTHYTKYPVEGIEDFLSYMKNGENLNSNTLKLTEKLVGINILKILSTQV